MALFFDCLFIVGMYGAVCYVWPKRAMVFGRWRYSPEFDPTVVSFMSALAVSGLILRTAGAMMVKRGNGGAIAIFIVEFLLAMGSVPARSRAKELDNRAVCAGNLHQIDQAIRHYAGEHEGRLPQRFADVLAADDVPARTFVCPSSNDDVATGATTQALLQDFARPQRCSYAYYGAGLSIPVGRNYVLAHDVFMNHDELGIYVLYGNGVVEWLPVERARHLVAELAAGHNPPP